MEATARKLDEDVAKDLQSRVEALEEKVWGPDYKPPTKEAKVGIIAATWNSPNKAVRIASKVAVALISGGAVYGGYRGVKAYRAKKAAAAQPQVTTL